MSNIFDIDKRIKGNKKEKTIRINYTIFLHISHKNLKN